ncbi:hypothetical protein K474DRAFT_430876 [Panus rudis PR-1116 ss-1]|nr:hypothetical protein K474DRAFT_430876 [Panus rudis PR-1116 ss-1]
MKMLLYRTACILTTVVISCVGIASATPMGLWHYAMIAEEPSGIQNSAEVPATPTIAVSITLSSLTAAYDPTATLSPGDPDPTVVIQSVEPTPPTTVTEYKAIEPPQVQPSAILIQQNAACAGLSISGRYLGFTSLLIVVYFVV